MERVRGREKGGEIRKTEREKEEEKEGGTESEKEGIRVRERD